MRTSNWLKRLKGCESGNVLAIAAATMPMIMGAAGLAVDTVQLALWKRQLQRAADSAAIAGAHAWGQGASTDAAVANDLGEHITLDMSKNEMPAPGTPAVTSGSYGNGTMSGQSCADRGLAFPDCFDQAVQVALTAERRLPFMSMFTYSINVIEADAVAAVTQTGGEFCMLSLYNGNAPGIIAGGNPNLDLSCGIATNARASVNAINIFGNATVNATPLAAVGGIAPGKNSYDGQESHPFSDPVRDPYAGVPVPEAPLGCSSGTLDVGNNASRTLDKDSNGDRCFANWNIQGDLFLESGGTYFVNGGTLNIKGKIVGENVTIVMLGDNSDLVQNGGGKLQITAPESGAFSGIALYRPAGTATTPKTIKINGGADLAITGAIYMPTTDVWIGGNAGFTTNCLQVIGRILEFKGGGTIRNQCDGAGITEIRQSVVRLVG